jgi:serine/threonine protein kinase
MNTPTPEDNKLAAISSANSLGDQYTREIAGSVTRETVANDPLLGVTVADRYNISSVIGIGGWSVVYRAHDNALNRPIAMKALHTHLCVDQTKLQRFQREAESASKLNHPNIATIYDCGDLSAGRPYISMELIEGMSLTEIIHKKGHLTPDECITLFSQLCDGMEAIHKLGLIHRDLKPSNVKVSPSGTAKILDFGLAKWILQDQDALTRSDESLGTPTYMSPEQCLSEALDARSDIYSLGCMMYEALTGTRPFTADNSLRCMQMHVQMEPARFRTVNPELKIPRFLELIVFKALEKNPRNRFASAAEMKAALMNPGYGGGSANKFSQFVSWHLLGARRYRRALIGSALALTIALVAFATWRQAGTAVSQPDAPKAERVIQFPNEIVGDIFLQSRNSDGTGIRGKEYINVKGPISVPGNTIVELANVPAEKAATLDFLASLQPKDLQVITLSNKPVTDKGLAQINRLKGLENMSLDDTDITDMGLEQLDLPLLGGLNLKGTTVTDKALPHLASRLDRLGYFCLREDNITDKGAAIIFNQLRVRSLDLSKTNITDNCLKNFNQPRMKSLKLVADGITDAGMECLSNSKSLKLLDLSETKITDKSVDAIAKIKSLKELLISHTSLTDEGFKRLKQALPDCIITK